VRAGEYVRVNLPIVGSVIRRAKPSGLLPCTFRVDAVDAQGERFQRSFAELLLSRSFSVAIGRSSRLRLPRLSSGSSFGAVAGRVAGAPDKAVGPYEKCCFARSYASGDQPRRIRFSCLPRPGPARVGGASK